MDNGKIIQILEDIGAGAVATISYATIVHEFTHLLQLGISTIVATTIVHFTRKFLNKHFKSNHDEKN